MGLNYFMYKLVQESKQLLDVYFLYNKFNLHKEIIIPILSWVLMVYKSTFKINTMYYNCNTFKLKSIKRMIG